MKTPRVGALLLVGAALGGCLRQPEIVIDTTTSNTQMYLLAVKQDGNKQSRKVVRCDYAADGSLSNCTELALILQEK